MFRLNWPKLGIDAVVYRVGAVQGGTLLDGRITLEAVEDIFGLPTNAYIEQEPEGWVSPNNAPAPAPYRALFEATFWDLVRAFGQTQAEALPADAGYLVAAAVRPSGDAFNFSLRTRTGPAAFSERDTGDFCASCTLPYAVSAEVSTTILYADGVDMATLRVGDYAVLENEWVAVTALNTEAGSLTIDRGILDTVAVPHAAGARLFFPYRYNGYDPTQRVLNETVDVKLLTVTSLGTLAEASAPVDSLTFRQRQARPYTPGNLKVNNARWPQAVTGDISIT